MTQKQRKRDLVLSPTKIVLSPLDEPGGLFIFAIAFTNGYRDVVRLHIGNGVIVSVGKRGTLVAVDGTGTNYRLTEGQIAAGASGGAWVFISPAHKGLE